MSQFSYTAETWAALAKNPVDRREAIGALATKLGGRLVELYYTFGEYDGFVLSDMPDDVSAAAVAIAAVTPGHVRSIKTTRVLTVEETMEALRKAGSVTYQAPR
jgi:uncharacterized protein with GYD domain